MDSTKIKQIVYLFIASVFTLSLSSWLLINYFHAKQESFSIYNANKKYLITGDYRDAKRSFKRSISAGAISIVLTDSMNIPIFSLRLDNNYIKIPINFQYDIYVGDANSHGPTPSIRFYYNIIHGWRTFLLGAGVLALVIFYWSRKLKAALFSYYEEKVKRAQLEQIEMVCNQVAHDIRSPLSSLSVAISFMDAKPEQGLKLIRSTRDRISEIIEDLEKVKSHKKFHKEGVEELNIGRIIDDIVNEKNAELGPCIHLTFDQDASGYIAIANKSHLCRIISNLINNAYEAIKSQEPSIDVSVSKTSCEVIVRIRDNGEGISSENLVNIFEKGFTLGKENGRGLGLFHCKSLMNQWKGSIEVESTKYEGSQFTLKLPSSVD